MATIKTHVRFPDRLDATGRLRPERHRGPYLWFRRDHWTPLRRDCATKGAPPMCTKFHLTRRDLIAYTEPLEIDLTLAEVMAVPGHWAEEKFVPAPLVRWAALPHEPGESRVATVYSPGNPGVATYKYRLTALST